jgi:fatty-acyl-CoA synthase
MVPDLLARRAALTPQRVAFRELVSGRETTFRYLDEQAARAATVLHELGAGAGERVAILCRNRIEFFEALFACARCRAILVPLNWRMPPAELMTLLEDAEPRLLVYGDEDRATAEALARPGMSLLPLDGADDDAYGPRLAQAVASPARAPRCETDCWYLIYTSGTTGRPKAVIYTFAMAVANYVNIRHGMGIGPQDVTLNFLPLFHTAGINLVTLPTLIEGGCSLVLPGFDLERVVDLLAQGSLDTFFGVPAVYRQISLHPRFDALELGRIRHLSCGGAPMPAVLLERFLERGAAVCNGMGMTETGPTALLMDPAGVRQKPDSVGRPQLLVTVRVVDSAGADVATGECGELVFAGPGVTPGYWRQPEATSAAFTADGWLRSGDIARVDADGYYYAVGRAKEMYISGGENVYPMEVEEVLVRHPAVLEVAVIGCPDPVWGEVGHAFVLPRPGQEVPAPVDLEQFCRGYLAAYKVPKAFVAVNEFPRTAAGKIRKHLLPRP